MHLEVIESFEELQNARHAWDAVYDADPEAQFFLSHQWIDDWLKFRTGCWFVLAVKPAVDSPDHVAFLPLRLRARFDAKTGLTNELSFAGAQFSDYTGILCRPEAEKDAIPLLAAFIKRQLNWSVFKLDNLLMSERRRRLFLKTFDKRKFASRPITYVQPSPPRIDNGVCPFANLPESWDAYLDQLSSNNRQKIRRLLKKVDHSDRYRITVLEGEKALEGIDMLLDFWRTKWEPIKGERTDDIVACNRGMLRRCARGGRLFVPVFWDGDRPVAVLGTLVDHSKRAMHFLITGRDESFSDLPAGYLLHAYSIRHAIAHGFRTYDFLRGNESYKYLFTTREAFLHACELSTHDRRNLNGAIDLRCLDYMIAMAKDFEEKGQRADAETAYRQIVEAAPDHALVLYRLGRLHARKGEHDVAIPWLRRSVEAEPAGDNAWKWLARSLQAQGQPKAALDAWSRVLEAQPGNEEANRAVAELRLATLQAPSPILLSPLAPAAPASAHPLPQLSIPEGRFALEL